MNRKTFLLFSVFCLAKAYAGDDVRAIVSAVNPQSPNSQGRAWIDEAEIITNW